MFEQIPTHVICGPLGAGKTSLLRDLLAQRPAAERWAVLINEFGQIGLDAALLEDSVGDGVTLHEVAGGCLCCVNGVPFQVGLTRLLRRARPQRLFIEPSGLGHPGALLRQLREPPWQSLLSVQAPVVVLDAAALAAGQPLADTQQAALDEAGLVLLNKSETLEAQAREALSRTLGSRPLYWTEHGRLPLRYLPGSTAQAVSAQAPSELPQVGPAPGHLWVDPGEPICHSGHAAEGWSIGWRWHPSQRFDLERLRQWLARWGWQRAKLIVHAEAGWLSANALQGTAVEFRPSEWRKDSRLELIFAEPVDEAALRRELAACRQAAEGPAAG